MEEDKIETPVEEAIADTTESAEVENEVSEEVSETPVGEVAE